MALPKFNDIPIYELTIPSTGQKVSYRPFLVKEQKVLLMALESRDDKQILNAIVNTLQACIQDPIDIARLSTFDVEYIFIQIRTKAAGETSNIGLMCQSCEHINEVKVNLEDIKMDLPKEKPAIKLNDQYTLMLKYPQYESLLDEALSEESTIVSQMYTVIIACLDSLNTEEERISFRDETPEEIEEFLNQLSTSQFDQIMEFINDLPRLRHGVDFICSECNSENNRVLEGITDFFQSPSLMRR
jgi:hypothetical protein